MQFKIIMFFIILESCWWWVWQLYIYLKNGKQNFIWYFRKLNQENLNWKTNAILKLSHAYLQKLQKDNAILKINTTKRISCFTERTSHQTTDTRF